MNIPAQLKKEGTTNDTHVVSPLLFLSSSSSDHCEHGV